MRVLTWKKTWRGWVIERSGEVLKCRCGAKMRYDVPYGKNLHRCGSGLGDLLSSFLAGCGLTKKKYVDCKRKIGLNPECGCEKRQQKLNGVL